MKADGKYLSIVTRRRINSFSNRLKILGLVLSLLLQNVGVVYSFSWVGGGVNTALIGAGYSSSLVLLLSVNGYHTAEVGISQVSGSVSESIPQTPPLHTEVTKSSRSPRKLNLVTSTLRTMGCLPKFFCAMDVKDQTWSDLAYLIKYAMKHDIANSLKQGEEKKHDQYNDHYDGDSRGNKGNNGLSGHILGVPTSSEGHGGHDGIISSSGGFVNDGDDWEDRPHELHPQPPHQSLSSEEDSNSKHEEEDNPSTEFQAHEQPQSLDAEVSVETSSSKPKPEAEKKTKAPKPTKMTKYNEEEALVDELLSKLEIAMEATKTKDDAQLETILADLKQMFRSGRSLNYNGTKGGERRGRGAFWEEFHFRQQMTLAAKIRHQDQASQKLDEICTSTFIHCPYTVSEMRYMIQSGRAEAFHERTEYDSLFPKPPPLTPPSPTIEYPKPPPLTPTPPSTTTVANKVRSQAITDSAEKSGEQPLILTLSNSVPTPSPTEGTITSLVKSFLPISLTSSNPINTVDDKSRSPLSTLSTPIVTSARNYGMSILNKAKPKLRNFLYKSAAYLGLSKPEEDVTSDDDEDDETGFDSNDSSHNSGGDYNDQPPENSSPSNNALQEPSTIIQRGVEPDITTRKSKSLPKLEEGFYKTQSAPDTTLPIPGEGPLSKIGRRTRRSSLEQFNEEPEEDEDSWEGQELRKTSSSEEHRRPLDDRGPDRHQGPDRDRDRDQEQDDHDLEDELEQQEEQARTSEEISDERDFSPGPPPPPQGPPGLSPPPPRPSLVLGHDFKKVEAQWASAEREPPESSEEEPKKKTKKKSKKKQKVSQDLTASRPVTPVIRPAPTTTTTTTTIAPTVANPPSKTGGDNNLSPLKMWEKKRLGGPSEPPKPQTTQQSIMEALFGARSTTSKPEDTVLIKRRKNSPFHLLIKNALTSEKVTNFFGQKVDIPLPGDEDFVGNVNLGGSTQLDSDESLWSPPFQGTSSSSKNKKRRPRPRPVSGVKKHNKGPSPGESSSAHHWEDQHTNSQPQATWSNSQEEPLVFSPPQSDYPHLPPMSLSTFDQSPSFAYRPSYQQPQPSQYPFQEQPPAFQFQQGGPPPVPFQYQSPPPGGQSPPIAYQQYPQGSQPNGPHVGPPPPFPYFRADIEEDDNIFGDTIVPQSRQIQKSSVPKKQVTATGGGTTPTRQRTKNRPNQAAATTAAQKRPTQVVPQKKRQPQKNPTRTTPTTTAPPPRQRTRTRGTPTPTTTERMESYGYTQTKSNQDKRRTPSNGVSHYQKQLASWEDQRYDDADTGKEGARGISWVIPNSRAVSSERHTLSSSNSNQPKPHFRPQIVQSESIHNSKSVKQQDNRSQRQFSAPQRKPAAAVVPSSKPRTVPQTASFSRRQTTAMAATPTPTRSYSQQRYSAPSKKTSAAAATVSFRTQRQQKSPSASASVNYVQKLREPATRSRTISSQQTQHENQHRHSSPPLYSYANPVQKPHPTSLKKVSQPLTRNISQKSSKSHSSNGGGNRVSATRQTLTARQQQISRSVEHQDSNSEEESSNKEKSPLVMQQQQTLQLFLAQQLHNLAEQQLKIAQQMPLLSSKKQKT